MISKTLSAELDQARAILAAAAVLLQSSCHRLAERCQTNGRLSTSKMEAIQPILFELANQAAAQQAAAQLLKGLRPDELATRLSLLYLTDLLPQLYQWRLRAAEFGLTPDEITSFWQTEKVEAFLQEQLSQARGEAISRLLEETGQLPADELTPEQAQLQGLLRRYTDERIRPHATSIHRQRLDLPEQFIDELAEMGCFGLSIPERYGGFQRDDRPDHLMMVIASDELSRGSFATAGSLITRPELLAKAILKGGTEAQKEQWLPLIAAGQRQSAVAITEPDYGSNVAGLTTRAERVEGGWRLTGTKMWCTFAGRAELLMVLARTDPDLAKGHRGLSLFIVEKPAAAGQSFRHETQGGRLEGRAIPTIGYRGMHSFELVFTNYFVPADNVIGGVAGLGRGFYLQMHGFAGSRLQTAGRALGMMADSFAAGLTYICQREVFGRPLLKMPLVRSRLALMAARLWACRRLTFYAAAELDQGGGAMAAAMAKLLTAQTAEWLTRQVQQWHGGLGYAEEFPISRHFVDARVLAIFEGAEEVLALRIIAPTLLETTPTPPPP